MPDLNLTLELAFLYDLQQIDAEILTRHKRLKLIPNDIQKLREDFRVHEQKLNALKDQLSQAEKEQRFRSAEIETLDEQRKKYQAQLTAVKTNSEMKALYSQLAFLDQQEEKIEDQILELMFIVDDLGGEVKKEHEILSTKNVDRKAEEAGLQTIAQDIKADISEIQEKRQNLIQKVNPDLFEQYQSRVATQHTNLVTPVVGNSCGYCKLTIPPQMLNEVKQARKKIACPSCKLILFELLNLEQTDDATGE